MDPGEGRFGHRPQRGKGGCRVGREKVPGEGGTHPPSKAPSTRPTPAAAPAPCSASSPLNLPGWRRALWPQQLYLQLDLHPRSTPLSKALPLYQYWELQAEVSFAGAHDLWHLFWGLRGGGGDDLQVRVAQAESPLLPSLGFLSMSRGKDH